MRTFKSIVLSISVGLITAVIVGGGVFLWQQQVQKSKNAEYDQQVSDLQTSVATAKATATAAQSQADKAAKTTTTATAPPVLFTGDGAAALTASVKTEFTTKLTDPYIAYYAQDGQVPVVSMLITVPTKKGDPYKVFAVRKSGGLYESFTYSKLGSALDTWKPTCGAAACTFSDDYKTKYPDVVK